MFGAGGLGGILPMLGMLGGGFSGGGLFSLGFTLLSGLLQNIGAPKHPGFNSLNAHPGFNSANAHPGFGTLSGGPNAQTVGSASGYFGNAYSNDYSILPQTPSGQYYANAGYSYGNHALTYAPTPPQGYNQQPYGYGQQQPYGFGQQQPYGNQTQYGTRPQYGYRQNMQHLQFGGNLSQYQNDYQHMLQNYPPQYPSYHQGQTFGTYGSAPAPYNQSFQPVMSHYGFGAPQQYNPASTLFGHQNGSVQLSYGQPEYRTTYGGPQGDDQSVVHHHYHHHIHIHDNTAEAADSAAPAEGADQPYGTQETKPADNYVKPAETPPVKPQDPYQPPVAATPAVQYPPTPVKPEVVAPEVKPVNNPGRIVASNATVAPSQTQWGRVPHVNSAADWARGSKIVSERITGGDSSRYDMGGNDPRVKDGMTAERMAAWHVFQQNDSLRLDVKSGYFYETKPDGSTTNKFHMSSVSGLQRQAGDNGRLAFEMVGDFLNQRGLVAPGLDVGTRVFNTNPVAQTLGAGRVVTNSVANPTVTPNRGQAQAPAPSGNFLQGGQSFGNVSRGGSFFG